MDPQACLQRWRNATLRGDKDEAREAFADLREWLAKGGFWPKGLWQAELDALKRYKLNAPADYAPGRDQFTQVNARRWMRANVETHRDPKTGEVNFTSLAEACAEHFDVNDSPGPLDNETHWIWDVAAEFG